MSEILADPVIIAGVARTPMAAFQGQFATLSASQLGAVAIASALERSGVQPDQVDEVVMGCVLGAGQGQAPARQATLAAKLPLNVGATTVNKMCGSGMRAVMFAHDMLLAGSARIVIAGGMESMTNAPYLLPKVRGGMRMGHGQMLDHMFTDGLEDAYEKGRLMGSFADETALALHLSRKAQDGFALESFKRARHAIENGAFKWEIAPVTVPQRHGEITIDDDELPFKADLDKISTLKPAFTAEGTVTAANASSIADGAAALVMMRASTAEQLGVIPLARIVGHTTVAQAPAQFVTAPSGALKQLLNKNNWRVSEVDLYEINEAFAVVVMAAIQAHYLPHGKVNVNGGACALGHPIGASGARILVTLLNALRQREMKRGIASLCIGGGEATAMGVELMV
ncbi:acetyl-CoA C-acetyltransferase [Paraburkholderia hayleyella]|uniref:acetyl-CoA C-acetyltransferase n=1 Tax=Paraburkholderia hayleyella TaxID=2152889 RepID=UPI0012908EA7|nr:acetyl-CoA C-acetyltransferase [Paraburkholderia hayleyella]